MTEIHVSRDIVPVSDFKSKASDWLLRLNDTNDPLVITQNGRAAAVMLSPRAYDMLVEKARFAASVQAGLYDADNGRNIAHVDMVAETRARYGKKKKR